MTIDLSRIDKFTTPAGHAAWHESQSSGDEEVRATIRCDCGWREDATGFDASAIALAAYDEHCETA